MKKLILLSLFVTLFSKQGSGQTFTNNLPISQIEGTGTSIPTAFVLQQIPIGFSFNFYGNAFTDIYLSPNGYLRFGTGLAGTVPANVSFMSDAVFDPARRSIIAFAWDYIKPGIYGTPIMNYFTTGTAPYRVLVINFKNISFDNSYLSNDPDAIVSVQLQLYEGSNTIEVHNLKNQSTGTSFNYRRTFGLSNSSGTLYPTLSGYDYAYGFNLSNKMVRVQTCTPPTEIPTITPSASMLTCGRDAVTLTASGCLSGASVLWSNGKVGNSILENPKISTSYSAACSTPDHCVGAFSPSQTIIVTNSIPSLLYIGKPVICPSATKTLYASANTPNGIFQWLRNDIVLTRSSNSTYSADSAAVFKVRYTIGSCVMTSDSVVLNRGVKPQKPTVSGNTSVCSGSLTNIYPGNCVGTINWVSGQIGGSGSIDAYPTVITKYAATCTNTDGCTSATSDTLVVTPIFTPTPAITSNISTACGEDTVTLTATGCAGGTLSWSDNVTYGNPIKKKVGDGTYAFSARCTDNGCFSGFSNTITIGTTQLSPTITSNIGFKNCQGDILNLVGNTSYSTGTWQWYKDGLPIAVGGNLSSYQTTQPGVYYVTFTTSICTSKSKTFTFAPLPRPTSVPTITSNITSICGGSNVFFSATGCGSDEKVLWYQGNNNFTYSTGSNVSLYAGGVDSFKARCGLYSASQNSYCLNNTESNTINITVGTPTSPTGLSASTNTVTCGGATIVTLTASGCANAYSWSSNANTTLNSASITVKPTATTTYYVNCKNTVNGCLSQTPQGTIVTVTNASPVISPSDTISTCPGATGRILTATTSVNGGMLQWANSSGNITSATNNTYNATLTDNYTVSQTVGACILTSKPVRVLIGQVRPPKISTSSNTNLCTPGSVSFTANSCSGTINWSNGYTGNLISTYNTTPSYIWATCSLGNNCTSPKSDSIKISFPVVEISPKKDTIFCVGGSYQLSTISNTAGITYQWKLNGNSINGATNSNYTVTTKGAYSVETTTPTGCVQNTPVTNLVTTTATSPVITGNSASCTLSPQKIWEKSLAGGIIQTMLSLNPTEYLLGGSIGGSTQPGGIDYWIVKTDSSGVKLWERRYGGNMDDNASKILIADGGTSLLLGGRSASGIGGNKTQGTRGQSDYWIVKTDINTGNVIWDKRFGSNFVDSFSDFINTSDNGFLIGGSAINGPQGADKTSSNKGNTDYWIVKINANGIKQWDKNYGNPQGSNYLNKVLSMNSNYLLCGSSDGVIVGGDKTQTSKGNLDFWIIQVDATGTKLWDKVIGGSNRDELKDAVPVSDGILLFGTTYSSISADKASASKGNSDYWLVKIDNNGNILWDKTFGGAGNEEAQSIKVLADGSIVMLGLSTSLISGDKTDDSNGINDCWIVKTDANGNKIWDKSFSSKPYENGDLIVNPDGSYVVGGYNYTNPANTELLIKAISCQTTNVPSTFVAGQAIALNATGCAGNVVWSGGGISATTSSISVTPTTITTYTATCSIPGCSASQSSSISIIIGNIPTPFIGASPTSATACANSPVTLTATGCPAGSTYLWTPAGLGSSMSISVTPAINTTYTVTCVIGSSNGVASTETLVKNVSQIESIATGNYNNPATWNCNCVPLPCSIVTINPLHSVTIPMSITGQAKNLIMKGSLEVKPTGELKLNMP